MLPKSHSGTQADGYSAIFEVAPLPGSLWAMPLGSGEKYEDTRLKRLMGLVGRWHVSLLLRFFSLEVNRVATAGMLRGVICCGRPW